MVRRFLPWLLPFLALLPAVASLPHPPIQDLPAHAAMIRVLAAPGPSAFWEAAGPLTHSWLPYLAGAAIAPITGAWGAALVLLCLAAIAWPLAVLSLSRAVGGDRTFALAAAGLAWGQVLVLGFVPFSLSSAAALAAVALLVRVRGTASTLIASTVAALLVWSLHAMGLAALAAGIAALVRPWRRTSAALAGLLPAILLVAAARVGEAGGEFAAAWGAEPPFDHLARLAASLGPASAAGFPDVLPFVVVAIAAGLSLSRPRADPGPPRASAIALAAFLAGAIALPDLVLAPSIVLATTRYLPFFAGLALAAVPPARPPWRAAAVALAAASLAWSTWILAAEGARVAPEAAAIRAMEPGHRVLAAPAHRAREDSLLATYSGVHLPMLYQADGRGDVLSAFAHLDSPVRLTPEAAAIVDLAGRDVVSYVRAGPLPPPAGAGCDRLLADAGDVPGFADATGADRLPPCTPPLPFPWICRKLAP